MKDIRLRDIPSFIRSTDPDDNMLDFFLAETERVKRASAVIINTYGALEKENLTALGSVLPPIYTIGPLHLQVNNIDDNELMSIGSNLWKEEPECLEWLDSKESSSVVYVNFGSLTVMASDQLIEFAWGLANTDQTFLWVIRPGLVAGATAILPPEFVTMTKDGGLLASWCPREQVLSHPSVGGFLTHSGWNSTLESICGGVPMVCWPFFAEQQTNCRYSVVEWGVGTEINSDVKRDEVESLVRELMDGEKGRDMRRKVLELKNVAQEATISPTCSSCKNLEELINRMLLSPKD